MARGPAAGEEGGRHLPLVRKDRGGRAAKAQLSPEVGAHRKASFHEGLVNLGQLEAEVGDCGNSLWEQLLCKHHARSQPLSKGKLSGAAATTLLGSRRHSSVSAKAKLFINEKTPNDLNDILKTCPAVWWAVQTAEVKEDPSLGGCARAGAQEWYPYVRGAGAGEQMNRPHKCRDEARSSRPTQRQLR